MQNLGPLILIATALAAVLPACEKAAPPQPAAPQPAPSDDAPARPAGAAATQPEATTPPSSGALPEQRETPASPPPTPAPAPTPAAPAAPPEVVNRFETDSGLIVEDLKIGEGPEAQPFDTVTVNYVGTLGSGREFDRSTKPTILSLTQVIKGWQEGIPGMKVGGKRRLIVPPELGYGSRARPDIPANSMLIFEIELVELPE